MKCDVCYSNKEVKNCDHLYALGSEGTNLCLDCRILVSNLLRNLMTMNAKVKKEMYIRFKK